MTRYVPSMSNPIVLVVIRAAGQLTMNATELFPDDGTSTCTEVPGVTEQCSATPSKLKVCWPDGTTNFDVPLGTRRRESRPSIVITYPS
jgi:hypothetical protein